MENFGETAPPTEESRNPSRKSKQPRSRQRKMSAKGKTHPDTPQNYADASSGPSFDQAIVVSDAMAINSRQLLYAHLYNYLLQNNYYETAKQFLREAEVPLSNLNNPKSPNSNSLSLSNLGPNQLLKSKMIISSPDTFLLEWWQSLLLLNNFVETTPADDLNSKLDYFPNQGFDKVYPILPRNQQQQARGYPGNMYMGMSGMQQSAEHGTLRSAPGGEQPPSGERGMTDTAVRLQQQVAAAAAQARTQARTQVQDQAHMQAHMQAQAVQASQAQTQVAQAQAARAQMQAQAQAEAQARAHSQGRPSVSVQRQGNMHGPVGEGPMVHPQQQQQQQQPQGPQLGQSMPNGMPINSSGPLRYMHQQQQQQQQMMMQQYPAMMNNGMPQQSGMGSQNQPGNKNGVYLENNQVVYPTNMSPKGMSGSDENVDPINGNSFVNGYDGSHEMNTSQQQQVQAQFASQKKKQSDSKNRSVSAQSQLPNQSIIQAQYQEHLQNRQRGNVNNVGPPTGPQSVPDMSDATRMGMDMNDPNMQQQYMSMLKSMLIKNQNPNQPQQQGSQPPVGGDNAMVDFSMINFNMMGQNNDMGSNAGNDSNDVNIDKGSD